MGFWIFMLCSNLLLPVLMIFFGKHFQNHPPREINAIYGYRTRRSQASGEAWLFAQQHFGRLWYRQGRILIPLTVLAMLPVFGGSEETVGIWGSIVCLILCAAFLSPCYFTEKALKGQFDEMGKPIACKYENKD